MFQQRHCHGTCAPCIHAPLKPKTNFLHIIQCPCQEASAASKGRWFISHHVFWSLKKKLVHMPLNSRCPVKPLPCAAGGGTDTSTCQLRILVATSSHCSGLINRCIEFPSSWGGGHSPSPCNRLCLDTSGCECACVRAVQAKK